MHLEPIDSICAEFQFSELESLIFKNYLLNPDIQNIHKILTNEGYEVTYEYIEYFVNTPFFKAALEKYLALIYTAPNLTLVKQSIDVLKDLMLRGESERVRLEAARTLLIALKPQSTKPPQRKDRKKLTGLPYVKAGGNK